MNDETIHFNDQESPLTTTSQKNRISGREELGKWSYIGPVGELGDGGWEVGLVCSLCDANKSVRCDIVFRGKVQDYFSTRCKEML